MFKACSQENRIIHADGEKGRWGDVEMGRRVDLEMGRWGDAGDGECGDVEGFAGKEGGLPPLLEQLVNRSIS
jgi:hypothetical protein